MIYEIYNYAIKNGLAYDKRFVRRPLVAHIILNDDGKFLGVEKIEKVKGEPKPTFLCPDIGRKAQGNKCNIICEKVGVIFGDSKKRPFYLQTTKELIDIDSKFKAIYTFLNEMDDISKFRNNELKSYKDGDYISFRVGEDNIESLDSWKEWYSDLYNSLYEEEKEKQQQKDTVLSFITGKEIIPIKFMDKVKETGLDGNGGVTLLCFDKKSFCSYGLQDCDNAPLSEEEMETINAGFLDLCKNHSNMIGNYKIIHWYKSGNYEKDAFNFMLEAKKEDEDDDLFDGELDEKTQEQVKNQNAVDLVNNVYNGGNTNIGDDIYYSFIVGSNNCRIKIMSNKEGSYTELKRNILQWKIDTTIEKSNITLDKYITPSTLFRNLLSKSVKDNIKDEIKEAEKEFGNNMIKLTYAIMDNTEIPECFLYNAITNIKQGIYKEEEKIKYKKDYWYRLIKAYLIRKGDKYIMPGLNPNNPNVAYQCGRLLAVYDILQQEAMKTKDSLVFEKWYGSASTTPALAFGPLARQAAIYFGKIEKKEYRLRYQKMIEEICDMIPEFPKTLSLQDQAYFSLGCYQQKHYVFKKNDTKEKEEKENLKEKEGEENNG